MPFYLTNIDRIELGIPGWSSVLSEEDMLALLPGPPPEPETVAAAAPGAKTTVKSQRAR